LPRRKFKVQLRGSQASDGFSDLSSFRIPSNDDDKARPQYLERIGLGIAVSVTPGVFDYAIGTVETGDSASCAPAATAASVISRFETVIYVERVPTAGIQ
jgi:hypothetical protein